MKKQNNSVWLNYVKENYGKMNKEQRLKILSENDKKIEQLMRKINPNRPDRGLDCYS